MMLTQGSKLAVLESKLNMYEDLSKEMLSRLESAVDKISEGNSRIATILAKHDEKIEQSIKTDALIIKMIDEVKESNTKEHDSVIERIKNLEKTVDDLIKFRWQTATIGAIIVIVVGVVATVVPPFVDNLMQNDYNGGSRPSITR